MCGHKTKQKGKISAFGVATITTMPINTLGSVDYCLKCIQKMAIKCAWCGKPIFIGDDITLYSPSEDFEIPDYAVTYGENKSQVVGCLRPSCADTYADKAGYWAPGDDHKGVARITANAYELLENADIGSIVIMDSKSTKLFPMSGE